MRARRNRDEYLLKHRTHHAKEKKEIVGYYSNGTFACVKCGFKDIPSRQCPLFLP